MKLQVILSQLNKSNNATFKASAIINIGEHGVESVSKEIAKFCKDVQKLCKQNKAVGLHTVNNIKKSLPMSIDINGLGEDSDVVVSLFYRNFGKFVETATEDVLCEVLQNNIEFVSNCMFVVE